MTKENIYLDLSKLTRKEIKEVYTILKDAKQTIYEYTEFDLCRGFKCKIYQYLYQFYNGEWCRFSNPNNKTEVTLSEFRELFQNLSNSTGLEKISAKDFILNNIPKLIQPIKDKIDWDLIQFSGNNMIDFAEKYYEFLTAKSK